MALAMAFPACERATAQTPISYSAGDLHLPSTRVFALVGKTGLGHEHGVLGRLKSGRLNLGATCDAGELVFDMSSFTADTDQARRLVGLSGSSSDSTRKQVTTTMLGRDVLNVGQYPTAVFKIDSATPERPTVEGQPQRYRLSGQFTLQRTARPLSFLAEVTSKNGWNLVRGSFPLKQSEYGIKPYSKAFGAVGVADEMTVWGELWVAPATGVAGQTSAAVR
ncbi:YceI-like domain protein [Botrimarina hoheduenensis]|uniref:YceI-like domain protein n=2 Tax=Botrimarina hoheduenensis TaxID=2528000 RepID=A0A5C5W9F0_9BACT|nr:YceI-like domain protein [Botrimarina hoheduenensis]